VLRHHPDKRRGAGEDIREDDDYFTCITKAFEQVSSDFRLVKYSVTLQFSISKVKQEEDGK
jgi:DnaJ family protein C protein 2